MLHRSWHPVASIPVTLANTAEPAGTSQSPNVNPEHRIGSSWFFLASVRGENSANASHKASWPNIVTTKMKIQDAAFNSISAHASSF